MEAIQKLLKKSIIESNEFTFNESLKSNETQCPQCGKTYVMEITKEQKEQGEGTSIQKEQHISGICSDQCWNKCFST